LAKEKPTASDAKHNNQMTIKHVQLLVS